MTLPTLGWLAGLFRSNAEVAPDCLLKVCIDSRKLRFGDVFWALMGHRNGHDFVESALHQGAVAAVVHTGFCLHDSVLDSKLIHVSNTATALTDAARDWRSKLKCTVVGLTGSVGKTTTKDFIVAALSSKFMAKATVGNFNNEIGVPLTILATPLESDFLVCEMGAAKRGDIKQLCDIAKPDCGLVTAIREAHLESFGSLEAIHTTKKELYDFVAETGRAFVPVNDPKCVAASKHCRFTFGYGFESAPHGWKGEFLQGLNLRFDELARPSFEFCGNTINLSIPGNAAAQAALAAMAVALSYGIHADEAARAVSAAKLTPGRAMLKRTSSLLLLDDSYNANPASMKSAIETLSRFQVDRKIAVLGDMLELGDATEATHKEILEVLCRTDVAEVVLVGSRFADVASKIKVGFKTHLFTDSETAALSILSIVRPGDAVLVKASRSMEIEKVVRRLEEAYQ